MFELFAGAVAFAALFFLAAMVFGSAAFVYGALLVLGGICAGLYMIYSRMVRIEKKLDLLLAKNETDQDEFPVEETLEVTISE